ncbi:MAG: hypothetical protein H7281_16195 [Bacteriovorax sp.]|nr:hypothetical protein [Bacteriovorax sp.]
MTNVSQKTKVFSSIPLRKIACNDKLQADVFIKIGVKELFVLNTFKTAFQEALEEIKQ